MMGTWIRVGAREQNRAEQMCWGAVGRKMTTQDMAEGCLISRLLGLAADWMVGHH